jgi:hypothetical protein
MADPSTRIPCRSFRLRARENLRTTAERDECAKARRVRAASPAGSRTSPSSPTHFRQRVPSVWSSVRNSPRARGRPARVALRVLVVIQTAGRAPSVTTDPAYRPGHAKASPGGRRQPLPSLLYSVDNVVMGSRTHAPTWFETHAPPRLRVPSLEPRTENEQTRIRENIRIEQICSLTCSTGIST